MSERDDPGFDPIARKARRLFDAASTHVEAPAARRLRAARGDALAASYAAPRSSFAPRFAWAGVAAAAVLAIALAWWLPQREVSRSSIADEDALIADPAMDEADLEFYAWLGEAPIVDEHAVDGGQDML